MEAKTRETIERRPELDSAVKRTVELCEELLSRRLHGEVELIIQIQPGAIPSWTISPKEKYRK